MEVIAQLKYGWIRGGRSGYIVPIGASEVLKAKSGRFMKNDASGRAEVAVDGSTELMGFLDCEEFTASATEGADKRFLINDVTAVFRIPVSAGTYTAAMLGETCDLAVSSSIQGAKLDGSGEDTLIIVGGDAVNNAYVDVMINPIKLGATGVV